LRRAAPPKLGRGVSTWGGEKFTTALVSSIIEIPMKEPKGKDEKKDGHTRFQHMSGGIVGGVAMRGKSTNRKVRNLICATQGEMGTKIHKKRALGFW